MAFLVAKNGPNAGKKYPIVANSVLGRHPDCQICIPEVGAVSRYHAKITTEGGQHFVEDMNSRNGTQLNGTSITQRQRLAHGDVIRICDVEFAFELDAPKSSQSGAFGVAPTTEESPFEVPMLVDDQGEGQSTVMSKVEVTAGRLPLQVSASPEMRLSAFMEISQSLGKALSLDEVLSQILNSLFKIFVQADRGFIVLRTEQGTLIPRWTKVRRPGKDENMRISRTIINKVIDAREAILSADASSDAQFSLSQSIAEFRIRSMMCAPLVDTDGKAFGALQIDTLDQRHRFQKEDLELLVGIAAQAAIAINNAQLHENFVRQKAIERDLQLAHDVQKGFLPERPADVAGYSFFHYYQPANEVGGDYFDYITLPDGRVAMIVADVVGHGVAAALMMAKLSAETRFCLVAHPEPGTAVTALNNRMSGITVDRFVTMILVVLDPKTHEATIVNAGHMAPIVRRANGDIEEPGEDVSGLPLGLMEDTEYEQYRTTIGSGDLFIMYTDGINESTNPAGDEYGIERLRQILKNFPGTPSQVGAKIVDDVRTNLAGHPQHDDMCLVCCARMPDA
ncbi:MAG: Phosphoserine phosphatase RsbP [Planctomycetota bacterium]